jgi:hypothetical protein
MERMPRDGDRQGVRLREEAKRAGYAALGFVILILALLLANELFLHVSLSTR